MTRRVFLGMPGYGNMTAAASRGFWRASRNMDQLHCQYQNGSLLACNFNALWCTALNMVKNGVQIDYFAMLHDDIGPQDFWLDELIDELEQKRLDVLGVVSPIKDPRGVTSLALHDPKDNWHPKCRLSMHDVYALPETFTSDDIGETLLLNTGCWVCRFDPAWVSKVHFTINDRIVFNTARNCYQAQTEPEDWYFSRLLHELGLRIGATRKIRLEHEGRMNFVNTKPWGTQSFDAEHTNRSPVPDAFPHEVEGWMTEEEGRKLAELSAGKRVLEIGSYCGRSTICMARTAEHVTAVDYFDGRCTPQPQDTLEKFRANIDRYGLTNKVTIANPDEDLSGPFGFAFVDGAHDYESVLRDAHRASQLLDEGGLIAFHDYDNGRDPEVTEAVKDFLSVGAELVGVVGSVAIVRPPVRVPQEV